MQQGELILPKVEYFKAKVIGDVSKDKVNVEIIEGEEKSKLVEVYNNGFTYKKGDLVFIQKTTDSGDIYYTLNEFFRLDALAFSFLFFMITVVVLFGWKGFRSLISILVSLGVIFFVFIPLILKGYNPLLISSVIGSLLLASLMLITHGRNNITYSAILGCSVAIFVTSILSYYFIISSKITGYTDESAFYLGNIVSNGVSLSTLVIAGVIIGVIGVVDDAAITQASLVAELKSVSKNLSKREYYKKAMNVGANHAGALVNTLLLVYLSSALFLVLLFYKSDLGILYILNKEIVATEIIRVCISSIGLLLVIPLTTIISIFMIKEKDLTGKHVHHH